MSSCCCCLSILLFRHIDYFTAFINTLKSLLFPTVCSYTFHVTGTVSSESVNSVKRLTLQWRISVVFIAKWERANFAFHWIKIYVVKVQCL
jgi:hypothetical protein